MVKILELKTTQTNNIKIVIDTLNSLLSDINITFYPSTFTDKNGNTKVGGVMIKELNKTQSILVQCRLDADQIEEYNYNYNGPKLTISINLNNFLKCLKCMSSIDTMTWSIDDEDTNKLHMILESEKDTKTFKINLMDLDNSNYEIEPVEFPYRVTMDTADFQKYCKDLSQATEKLDLKCTENAVFFSGKGDLGYVEFEKNVKSGNITIEKMPGAPDIVQGLFELKYLLIFTKCTNLCEKVTLHLQNQYPLLIRYSVSKIGELKLVLSPCKPDF